MPALLSVDKTNLWECFEIQYESLVSQSRSWKLFTVSK